MNETRKDAEKESLGILTNIVWFFSIIGSIIGLIIWTFFLFIVSIFENLWHYQKTRRVDKEKFWINVGKCLVEFHGYTIEHAVDTVNKYKYERKTKPPAFYYMQPFKIAIEITGHDPAISLDEYRERYLKKILEQ